MQYKGKVKKHTGRIGDGLSSYQKSLQYQVLAIHYILFY